MLCCTCSPAQYRAYDRSHGTAAYTDPEQGTASPYFNGRNYSSETLLDGRYKRNRSRDFVHLPEYAPSGSYRQPSAMVSLSGSQLLIATKQTGEIYRLDTKSGNAELEFGPSKLQLEHLVMLSDDHLLVSDNAAEQIVVLQKTSGDSGTREWKVTKRLNTPGKAGGVTFDAFRRRVVVSGVWSRQLYQWSIDESFEKWTALPTIDLDFGGGIIATLPGSTDVVVADAFGSNLSVVDTDTSKVVNHQHFDHNIKSMFVDAERGELVYGHQLLNEFIPAIRGEITWGGMLSNNIRQIKLSGLTNPNIELDAGNVFTPLGFTGQGGGQPTSIRRLRSGRFVATLGGTSKLAIQTDDRFRFNFFATGLFPVQCELSSDESQVFVLNQFGDSVSVFDIETGEAKHYPLGSVRSPTLVERGEQLFHDSRLSHDGWMSCESCHSRGHTTGGLNDNLSDFSQGTPKRILSLLGQRETAPYSWFGAQATLEDQISHSISSTMASDHSVKPHDVEALASFVASLPRPPSVASARIPKSEREKHDTSTNTRKGKLVFESQGCANCHTPPLFTSDAVYDVALQDEQGNRKFNPPSLLAVSQRESALLHDGRAKSLEDVVLKYKHQIDGAISAKDASRLIAYLRGL